MRRLILKISESNMAGYSWGSNFYLESKGDGTYTLSSGSVEPVSGIRDGADIYERLETMVADSGYALDGEDLHAIADKIAKFDPVVAEDFRQGPGLLERRYEDEKEKEENGRVEILRPYREIIDRYVAKLSDQPLRFPGLRGGSYGNMRGWIKRFIEDYVVANGRLPTGEHSISVRVGGTGFSGGLKDFSDLK